MADRNCPRLSEYCLKYLYKSQVINRMNAILLEFINNKKTNPVIQSPQ